MLLLATRSCAPSKKAKKKSVRQKKTIYLLHFSQKPQPGSQQQKLPKNDSVKYELAGSGKLPSPSSPTPPARSTTGNTVQMQFATVVHAAN